MGCTDKRKGSKLFLGKILEDQEEPVEDDNDEVTNAKMWTYVKTKLNVAVLFH